MLIGSAQKYVGIAFVFVALHVLGYSQQVTTFSEATYDSLKIAGSIDPNQSYVLNPLTRSFEAAKTGYTPPGPDFIQAIPASDDGSSAEIILPFPFCFFGENRTSVYINTNGNISFNAPFSTSTALPLPQNTFQFIAPFWADVDTRGTGAVWYRLTSTALYVVWEEVGYFDQNTDRTNTFQVVLTNGFDPALPSGYNVGLFYRDMEWTAGDGSGGTGGLGGAPATAGINRGNGTDFIQIGRFDNDGSSYDGAFGNIDGTGWLTNRNVYLSTCDTSNIPPVVSGVELSDTIRLCLGDVVDYDLSFLSPEAGQVTSGVVLNSTLTGFNVLSNTSGEEARIRFRIPADTANIGFHTVFASASDNGTPIGAVNFPIVVQVDSLTVPPVIAGDTTVCDGDSVLLTVTPAFPSYQWSTGSDSAAIRVPSGTYDLTVTEGLCRGFASYTVVRKNPDPVISGPSFICLPDTVTLSVPDIYDSYQWSTAATDTLDSVSVTTSGLFTVTVEDDGCFGTASLRISHLGVDPYTMSISDSNSCNGDSVTLNARAGFDTYLWNTTQNVQQIRVDSGDYSVIVTLASADPAITCSDTDSVSIGYVSFPPLSLTFDSIFCNGDSTTIMVDSTYGSYQWSTTAVTQSITVSSTGTYRVTVTTQNCTADTAVTVTEGPLVVGIINGRSFYCPGGDSVELSVATTWDSIFWSTGDTVPIINVIPGSYGVKVWQNGCSDSTFQVVDTLRNGFSIGGDRTYCSGDVVGLDAGFGFDSYLWNTTDTVRFITVQQGDYVVTVTLDTCIAESDSITVSEIGTTVPIISGDTQLCLGTSGILTVQPFYTDYTWSTGSQGSVTPIASGGVYSVTVQDTNNCVLEDSITVQDILPAAIVVSGNPVVCYTDSTTLSIPPYPSILWSTGATTTSITVDSGRYFVQIVDSNGCRNISSAFPVTRFDPDATIQGDTLICEDETTILSVLGARSFNWSTGDTTDSIPVPPGSYLVTVTDFAGCLDTAEITVSALPEPNAAFISIPDGEVSADQDVQFVDQSTISAGQIVAWDWLLGPSSSTDQNPIIRYTTDGQFGILLEVTSDSGCTDTASALITIFSGVQAINVITPNGDGINDILEFPNLDRYTGNKLQIFNRWGELIYKSDNYLNSWDGRFMADGTYYYILEVPDTDETLTGSFTLLK